MSPKNKKLITLNSRLWRSFILYGIVLLVVLWLLQSVFLGTFYRRMKIAEINKISNRLTSYYGEPSFEDLLYKESLRMGIAIQVVDKDGKLLYPVSFFESLNTPRIDPEKWIEITKDLVKNPDGVIYENYHKTIDATTITSLSHLGGDLFLYINSLIEPIDSTANILKQHLILVSALVVALSLLLSYWMSKKLSEPLTDLKQEANKLAKGDLTVNFSSKGYKEVEDLARCLNLAKEELEQSLSFRKDLIGNVSHDLKTPLTIILSYAEMIRDITGDNKELRENNLDVIINEAHHLTWLVNELLDLSKIEAGMAILDYENFDIKQLTKFVITRLKPVITDNINITLNGPDDCIVFADKSKLEQVIYNLLNNAIQYTGEDGYVEINVSLSDSKIYFEVCDSGIGVPNAEKERIWERYVKTSNHHSRHEIGSGLGLYIVKTILTMHGLDYGVKDRIPRGSIFYFSGKLGL